MANNSSLNTAKVLKNDESYTRVGDIEKELRYYKPHFEGKVVHCNCDDPESSEFYAYFKRFFKTLKLSRVICTGMSVNQKSWMKPVGAEFDGKNEKNLKIESGDFASSECKDLMDKSDIVVTNPPFSLFRKYMDQLMIWSGGGGQGSSVFRATLMP